MILSPILNLIKIKRPQLSTSQLERFKLKNSNTAPVLSTSSQDTFTKNQDEETTLKTPFEKKLAEFYKSRNSSTTVRNITCFLETPEERTFIEEFLQNNTVTRAIEDAASELYTFRIENKRSMNEREMKIFKDLLPGLEYRTKRDINYHGNEICKLIPLAFDEENKRDILSLLKSDFLLNTCKITTSDDESAIFQSDTNIGSLIKYKKENPDIAHLIIPYAIKTNNLAGNDFELVKNFFDMYKKEKSALLEEFSHNINLNSQEVKILYETLIQNPNLLKIIEPKLKEDPFVFMKFLLDFAKKYPEFSDQLETLNKIPNNYTKKKSTENLNIEELAGQKVIKDLTGNNPKIESIKRLLPKNRYIDWLNLIGKNCTKAQANNLVQNIYEALCTKIRLDSIKFKEEDNWTIKNKIIIDCASHMMKKGAPFREVLLTVAKAYSGIFKEFPNIRGQLRDSIYSSMVTPYGKDGYSEYKTRFDKISATERKSPFKDMKLTQIFVLGKNKGSMVHPDSEFIEPALNHAKESYDNIMDYIQRRQNGEKLNINELIYNIEPNIAQMHYILTNSLPFIRGTAGIANIMTRAQYKALGITYPATRQNIGLDLEAFCTPLDKYKKNWSTFFEVE